VEACTESGEQREVGLVADRLPGRIGANRQPQSNGREQRGSLADRKVLGLASLDPAVARRRDADRSGDMGLGQRPVEAGAPELIEYDAGRGTPFSPSALDDPFACRYLAILRSRTYPALIWLLTRGAGGARREVRAAMRRETFVADEWRHVGARESHGAVRSASPNGGSS
jgi:hypothetical protein